MRIHFKTLGCRLNEAELESWSRDFHARGHEMTRSVDDAELVIINTCAVTEEAVKKSRKLLRKAQRDNPHAKLIVSGCYASLSPDSAQQFEGVDLVIPNTEKSRLVDIAHEKLNLPELPVPNVDDDFSQLLFSGRQRAFVKVQDGCRYRCTFCIVTIARGEEQSRSIDDVISEINLLHAQGIREVVLTGVHLGGYGSDQNTDLSALVNAVLEKTDVPRIRMGSLEPWELHENFWDLFENPRVMPHLHLPLQSGADPVLRRMARRCHSDEFSQLVDKARLVNPLFNITTDIIVGFPGETRDEWSSSLTFVEKMNFGHVHIFAFSPRQGTKAATLPDPVSRETKRDRSQQLHDLSARMKQDNFSDMVGRSVEVLLEGNQQTETDGSVTWFGYTPNFLRTAINIQSDENLCNRILPVNITGFSENTLTGELKN